MQTPKEENKWCLIRKEVLPWVGYSWERGTSLPIPRLCYNGEKTPCKEAGKCYGPELRWVVGWPSISWGATTHRDEVCSAEGNHAGRVIVTKLL